MRTLLSITVLCSLASAAGAAPSLRPRVAVPALDMQRYAGRWYEIARYRQLGEALCRDATETITPLTVTPPRAHVVFACDRAGLLRTRSEATLYAPDPSAPGRLVWEYRAAGRTRHAHYDVLAIDPLYQWALVGMPERAGLWILSRTPALDPAVLRAIISQADGELGYPDAARYLHCTPQRGDASHLCAEVLP